MNVKRLLLAPGSILVLTGALLACFAWGGWLNQPRMWTYVWHDTDLARLSQRLGFVPDGNTVLPLIGVGLMLAGTGLLTLAGTVLTVLVVGRLIGRADAAFRQQAHPSRLTLPASWSAGPSCPATSSRPSSPWLRAGEQGWRRGFGA